ncbi:MAG: F0F1 ATP synthase subunit B [Anaerolineae bacterium]
MDKLGINTGYLISQIINFLLILFILQRFLYKPVLKMLDERRERIRTSMEEAEEARRKAAEAEEEYQKRIEQARKEAEAIVARAEEEAQKARDAILEEARADARRLREQAEAEVEFHRRQVLEGMRDQVADLAILAASKVIGRSLDEDGHRRLVKDFLAEEL